MSQKEMKRYLSHEKYMAGQALISLVVGISIVT